MVPSGVKFFVRAVATGFALSLGSALFKKIQDRIGLGEEKAKAAEKEKDKKSDSELASQDVATDPSLQS